MATLIVTGAPAEGQGEAQQRYQQAAMPLLMDGGGKMVKRLRVVNAAAGGPAMGAVVVMDCESAEAINAILDGDGYKALIADRDKGFTDVQILVTEDLA